MGKKWIYRLKKEDFAHVAQRLNVNGTVGILLRNRERPTTRRHLGRAGTWAELIESFRTYFLPRDFFTRLADQVRQRKQGFSESFKDYMIDMQTMVRPLNYSTKDTLRVIKENCTPSLQIFLRAYKVSALDMLMILADEYEELEKEREVFTQENKFSKTKSASPTQVTCRRCEETDNQDTRGNDQWSPPQQARRQQATDAQCGGQWTPPPRQ